MKERDVLIIPACLNEILVLCTMETLQHPVGKVLLRRLRATPWILHPLERLEMKPPIMANTGGFHV